jgi:7-alpha-hydroxysteroid dehydrogenase
VTQPSGGLEGYAALVTGGGTGIGKGCAARLAADGAAVTICGRTESRLVDAAKVIGAEISATGADRGGSVQYVTADVTDEDSVKAAVEFACGPTGGLDAVIANAGGGGGMAPPHMQDVTEFTRVLHLNVLGTLIPMKYSVPQLVKSGRGSFVGMSSIAGEVTHLWFGAYPVGKAGLEALIRNAADEYGPTGVRFNAIRPGFISTEIMEGIPREGPVYESYLENTPMAESRAAGVGEPEDVAALARFLVGEDSRWITGQIIDVDGGHHLRRGPNFTAFIEPALGWDVMLARKGLGDA